MWNQWGICLRFLSASTGPGLLSSVSKIKGGSGAGMKPPWLVRGRKRGVTVLNLLPLVQWGWRSCWTSQRRISHIPGIFHVLKSQLNVPFLGLFDIFLQSFFNSRSLPCSLPLSWSQSCSLFFVSLANFYFQQAYCYLTFAILSSVAQKGWLTESRVVGNIGSAEEIILSSFFHHVL